MKNKISSCLLVAACIMTSSCAGLISGKTQNVFLRTSDGSDNVNVEVSSVGGTQNVTIPANVVIPRGQTTLAISVKENNCHKESKTYITPKYNIMLLADAIGGLFGLTGTTMDMSSGAAWSYEDNIIVDVKSKHVCK